VTSSASFQVNYSIQRGLITVAGLLAPRAGQLAGVRGPTRRDTGSDNAERAAMSLQLASPELASTHLYRRKPIVAILAGSAARPDETWGDNRLPYRLTVTGAGSLPACLAGPGSSAGGLCMTARRAAVMNGSLVAKLAARRCAEWMICMPLGHILNPRPSRLRRSPGRPGQGRPDSPARCM
jgi:hypothetical protein